MEGEGQVKGKRENPLTSEVTVDGVLYRFKLRSSESTISGSTAPKSSHYVDLSEYPPGTDIERELHWDGSRIISKVPRWAHEKWLRKLQNAGDPDGTITPHDTSPTETLRHGGNRPCEDRPNPAAAAAAAAAAIKALKLPYEIPGDNPSEILAAAHDILLSKYPFNRRLLCKKGAKRPCEDHPNSASATDAASGTKALKRPREDLVENSSATAAVAYGGRRPCEDHPNSASATAAAASVGAKAEVGGSNSSASGYPWAYEYAYVDPSAVTSDDYPGRYSYFVEDGRVVLKVDESVGPIKTGGRKADRMGGGIYYPKKAPVVMKVDESTGHLYRLSKP